jgi:hypothetical protein
VLLDLIEMWVSVASWFAAAKNAVFLDVALLCARDYAADPATVKNQPLRAARDFARLG